MSKRPAHKQQRKKARIRLKLNNITNYKIISKLYEASRAGVKIDMIVRGVCCLIPGVKGMSENIRVISVVDKFLEHPGVYFENDGDPQMYISSADWMTRNIDNRVEVACPILDKDLQQELLDTYMISWNDNVKARLVNTKIKTLCDESQRRIDHNGPLMPILRETKSMKIERYAAIDIGSNAVRVLISNVVVSTGSSPKYMKKFLGACSHTFRSGFIYCRGNFSS